MQVIAFSTPQRPHWRWRIVNNAGETIQESPQTFPTIAAAVADGSRRMSRMSLTDTSVRPRAFGRAPSRLKIR